MRFKDFIQEAVIDARDKFQARRAKATQDRNFDTEGYLQQLEREKAHANGHAQRERGKVKDRIEQLQVAFEKKLKKYRLELAPVISGFHSDVTIMQLIAHNSHRSGSPNKDVTKFVKDHYVEVKAAVDEYEKGLNDLFNWLQTLKERHGLDAVKHARRELRNQVKRAINDMRGA
jgi:hypothetical protein